MEFRASPEPVTLSLRQNILGPRRDRDCNQLPRAVRRRNCFGRSASQRTAAAEQRTAGTSGSLEPGAAAFLDEDDGPEWDDMDGMVRNHPQQVADMGKLLPSSCLSHLP
jgi:hypothetical protein